MRWTIVMAASQPIDASRLPVEAGLDLVGQNSFKPANGAAHRLHLAEDVGVEARAAREADLLLALGKIEQRFRERAPWR